VLERIADGALFYRMLAYHGQGLREYFGLPVGEWSDSAERPRGAFANSAPGQKPKPRRGSGTRTPSPSDRSRRGHVWRVLTSNVDLREYRHSSLTHLGEQGASPLMLMAKSRHKAGERPPLLQAVPEAIAELTSLLAPGDGRR
jgi:hypothetical protein